MTILLIASAFVLFMILLYVGQGYLAWVSGAAIGLMAWWMAGVETSGAFWVAAAALGILALVFGLPPIRRVVVSAPVMRAIGPLLPKMGDTERTALEAGTVWFEGELFSGAPDWSKLLDFEVQPLTEAEQAFIDGPVERLCHMLNEFEVVQRRDLPAEVWEFLKEERFFGMIIPEEYGGLGFSAQAHSAVVTKVASRSLAAAVTVMVPNSLGPAELLLHYGTDGQKSHYLPRLARGEEVPCFALTEPTAGSDAASARSQGIVCRGQYGGKEVLGMRLTFAKRYITLAPVATVLGLAFRLRDPEGLLGGDEDLGITCALVPRDTPGIEIGDRHDPMGVPFMNGPVFGRDVFVPLDFVIGGRDGVGQGWKMLMESLSVGRSISLPALSVGAAELSVRVAGAYGTVREQFNLPVGRFEGVEELLARIGGYAYLMNAARRLTCGAVDAGERPSVPSAIVKRYLTGLMRDSLNDAMDIRAGAAICRGPSNILGRAYLGVPIAITVEGSNVLTRSLIVYGQGAIRCHPFVRREMEAALARDAAAFDVAFFGHLGFLARNGARAFVLALTRARVAGVPAAAHPVSGHLRTLTRLSAAFALVSDAALGTLGGDLKRREKISGRLADALAWLYLGSAAAKRFLDDGRPDWARPYLDWSCRLAAHEIEQALLGALENLPNRMAARLVRWAAFPLGGGHTLPADRLGAKVARGLLDGADAREHLSADIHIPPHGEAGLGRLEAALEMVVKAAPARRKVQDAVRAGKLERASEAELADKALAVGIVDALEHGRLKAAAEARDIAIQVDVFDPSAYAALKG